MRAVEEQSHGFTSCLSQKALGEQSCSLVEDYMGEEEGENTYNARVLLTREEQPTHRSNSSVFDNAYRGNVIKVTILEGKDNARDVVKKGVVKKGQEEEVKKEKNLQMCMLPICRPLPLGCTGLPSDGQIKSSPEIVVICKPV
jgi:hypothetical protein